VSLWTHLAEAADRGEAPLVEIAVKRAAQLEAQAALHGNSHTSPDRLAEIKREHARWLEDKRGDKRSPRR
jgi:hypothetical protein